MIMAVHALATDIVNEEGGIAPVTTASIQERILAQEGMVACRV
jgi:hypothetical protein